MIPIPPRRRSGGRREPRRRPRPRSRRRKKRGPRHTIGWDTVFAGFSQAEKANAVQYVMQLRIDISLASTAEVALAQ